MTKFTIAALAAITLVQPVLTLARDKPTHACARPSSFVPHPRTNHHVYGAPVKPAIVGHSKTSHHKHTAKKPSASIASRDAL
jgi:hypothetical protein